MKSVFTLLRRADLLQPRVEEDAKIRTSRGGALFLLACVVSLALAHKSIMTYLSPSSAAQFSERMEVDTEMSVKLPLKLNITFFHLSCLEVELVALDVAGEVQFNIDSKSLHKTRITANGLLLVGESLDNATAATTTGCGSCYGAEEHEGDCCRTCMDVKLRYQKRGWDVGRIQHEAVQCSRELDHPEIPVQHGEGCIVQGAILLNKVAGNVHFALGTTQRVGDQIVHTFAQQDLQSFDTSHHITTLRFGAPQLRISMEEEEEISLERGGVLDGVTRMVDFSLGKTAAMQYHLHLVPSRIVHSSTSYRYSVTERYIPVLQPKQQQQFTLPGVYFMYDLSPFVVVREPVRVALIDFVADMLTLCGGMFALVRVLDAIF